MPPIRTHTPLSDGSTPTHEIKTKPTQRRSWIWLHGTEYVGRDGEKRWRCDHCPRSSAQTYADGSSGKPRDHLGDKHNLFEDGIKRSTQTTIENSKPPINPKVLRKLIVEWVIDRRHAFNEIEAESFRKILAYIDVAAVSKLPKSGNTIRADAIKYFMEARQIIKELLTTVRSLIHLSFDL
jgi:hypothetical protein